MADVAPREHALTPYLIVNDGAGAIEFYHRVFGAVEHLRLNRPNGKVAHATLQVRDSLLMLADEDPAFGAISPGSLGGSPVNLHLYVENVDQSVARAEEAGAIVLRKPKDEFYGDRAGMICDPFGHRWHLATRPPSEVSPDEMKARWSELR